MARMLEIAPLMFPSPDCRVEIVSVLQNVVADYGNVNYVRGHDVRNEHTRSVIAYLVVHNGQQIFCEMSRYGMIVVKIVVAPPDKIGICVLVAQSERRSPQNSFCYGVAQKYNLRFVGGYRRIVVQKLRRCNGGVVASRKRDNATNQHRNAHSRRNKFFLHFSSLPPARSGTRPDKIIPPQKAKHNTENPKAPSSVPDIRAKYAENSHFHKAKSQPKICYTGQHNLLYRAKN